MKLNAKISRIVSENSQSYIEFVIPRFQANQMQEFVNANPDAELTVSISKKKESKTDQQRKYAWVIITKIDKAMNAYSTELEQTYIQLLKYANISPVYLEGTEEVQATLERTFRVVEVIEPRVSKKGVDTLLYRCHKGISLLNKEEMTELIDVIKMYASYYEIPVESEMFYE